MATNAYFILFDELILILRRNVYAKPHQHNALQVTFALDGKLEATVNQETESCAGIIIPADTKHLVHGQPGWVVTCLINPESNLAGSINQKLAGQRYLALQQEPSSHRDTFQDLIAGEKSCTGIKQFMADLDNILGLTAHQREVDERITEAIRIIESLPDKKIPATGLSGELALSESRFRHLFKQEIGIPLRRYLLWQRLLEALKYIVNGMDFTTAAHEAAFTDSSHLNRTFHAMFGISPSDLFASPDDFQFISCE